MILSVVFLVFSVNWIYLVSNPKSFSCFFLVSTQRRQYRILSTEGNTSVPLTVERAQQLIDLGFEWSAKDPSHKSWEDRYQELCDYVVSMGIR